MRAGAVCVSSDARTSEIARFLGRILIQDKRKPLYNQLYGATRRPASVTSALCWSHARRKFFELADVEGNIRKGKADKEISPVAFEAVRRINVLFDVERDINGLPPQDRLEARQRLSTPLIEDLQSWLEPVLI